MLRGGYRECGMRLRVYIDTSVFSGLLDDREPARQEETKLFFPRLHEFEVSTSEQTRREIEQTHDEGRRAELLTLLERMKVTVHTPSERP